ncbi:helix-turn-helix domain-containing protein (plasmid) [Paracoccus methylovorus]|uniref:Helix-turn-helix domain-containing protein n=1 Tax=Paracoccus methylovorus TaxID=2812658 RepID=A0ABX7JLN9_9RHOB|nr:MULTISPECIES: AraC family transcriptional regulator [Paracoccus]QRZ14223.1 helix-turn-helix domain-containing protein [Paracoccus methylovorus]
MSFRPRMTSFVEGISLSQPLAWRAMDGVVVDYWQVEGKAGGGGYYLSPDPRIVIFLDDITHSLHLTKATLGKGHAGRPMGRAIFVPAGVPLWSRLGADEKFSHVDLHFDEPRLVSLLASRLGSAGSARALQAPVILERSHEAEVLGGLLAQELSHPRHHDFYVETLVQGILASVLPLADIGHTVDVLASRQMQRVMHLVEENLHRRISVAELAEAVGLSESWFAHAFKRETGQTPLQWQTRRRIERAQQMLEHPDSSVADVAAATGFADQAHLTRVFRSITGSTPGAWRKNSSNLHVRAEDSSKRRQKSSRPMIG